jgi:NADPH:quinone reductase-like Zn-dependent oxidoreductase
MKAMVYHNYGSPDVLQLEEVEKPTPKDTEVLIKVHATSVSPADWHFRSGTPFVARIMAGAPLKPKIGILGLDVAGEIEAVGSSVQRLKEGDPVYGLVPPNMNGANAEYTCIPEENVLIKPVNLTYEEAAAIPAAAGVALLFLRAGGIQSGQRVLINGASGGLGTSAVQLAKSLGAEVTGVCSTRNVELVESLGADEVIDYTKEDFTQSGQPYDLVFDAVGKSSFPKCRRSLNRSGVYVSTVLTPQIVLSMLSTSITGSKKALFATPRVTPEDLQFVNGLVEAGKLRPVIDRSYPLSELAEAHRYAEMGHVRGRVIITVPD